MDVTKANFTKARELFERLLPESSFVSVDLEFSGLCTTTAASNVGADHEWKELALESAISGNASYVDDPYIRYRKNRTTVNQFSILQLGITLFHQESEHPSGWVAFPFNFWSFPSNSNLIFDPKSLVFLRENKFDFNFWIENGVSICNEQEYEQYMKLEGKRPNLDDRIPLTKEEDVVLVKDAVALIREWLQKEETAELNLSEEPLNAYQRRLLYQELPIEFSNTIKLESVSLSETKKYMKTMKVSRMTEEDWKADEEEKRREAELRLEEQVGVQAIFQLLRKHKKPIVGHNMFLDLLYLHDKLIGPLPECYSQFKNTVHEMFPVVLDTKALSKDILGHQSASTSLSDVYAKFMDTSVTSNCLLQVKFGDEFTRYSCADQQVPHEAGFDSYMTGFVFLQMYRRHSGGAPDAIRFETLPLLNTINVVQADYSVSLDVGKEEDVDRSSFLLLMFKSPFTIPKLNAALSAAEISEYTIYRVSDVAYWLKLLPSEGDTDVETPGRRSDIAAKVCSLADGCCMEYVEFRAWVDGGGNCENSQVKRRRLS